MNIQEQIKAIEPNFVPPRCELVGRDGNAFAILGRVSGALKKAGYKSLVPLYQELAMSSDYDHLLAVTLEFIEEGEEDEDE